MMPIAGSVLIRDAAREIVCAVGVRGDTSGRDEECAGLVVEAAGLAADTEER